VACQAVATRKAKNVDARQCYLQQLSQIPGVSHKIACTIADAEGSGSMAALCARLQALPDDAAREKALQALPLVGPVLSRSIVQKLF
jgi:hypothetical protein